MLVPHHEARRWRWLEECLTGTRHDLLEVKKQLPVPSHQPGGDALNCQALPPQPEHRSTDLLGERAGDEDDPLAPGRIELQGSGSPPSKERFDPILGTGCNACPVEITLMGFDDALSVHDRGMGRVLGSLPRDIRACGVQFSLDDHEASRFIEGKDVDPTACPGQTAELLAQHKQVFAQRIWPALDPLLQVAALTNTEFREASILQGLQAVACRINLKHATRRIRWGFLVWPLP